MLFVTLLALSIFGQAAIAQSAGPSGAERHADSGDPSREDWQTPPARRLVILGSSSAAGAGASSYGASWAGRLTEALAPLGVTVINRSINGSNTAASIERFARDVEALRPRYVVLSTSLHNELVLTRREEARKEFIENTRRLVEMSYEIGAIPILTTPFPNNAFDAGHRDLMTEVISDLERFGVPVWDFWGSVDNGSGRFLPGHTKDGLHPLDPAHRAFFEAIPLGLFDWSRPLDRPVMPSLNQGSWTVADLSSCRPALAVHSNDPLPSWTMAWSMRSGPENESWHLSAGPFRVAFTGRDVAVSGPEETSARATLPEAREEHNLMLSYQAPAGLLKLTIDGSQAVELAVRAAAATDFQFDSDAPARGLAVGHVLLYRAPIPPKAFQFGRAGWFPVRSLEAWISTALPPSRYPVGQVPGQFPASVCAGAWSPMLGAPLQP